MKSKPKDFKTIDDAIKKISKPELDLEQLLYFEQLKVITYVLMTSINSMRRLDEETGQL